MGLVVGLLAGLALALGVALYITKAPVPFINKVPQRSAEQDNAEAERNRNWDPNAPLAAKGVARPIAPAASEPAPAALPPGVVPPGVATAPAARPPARDPAQILGGGAVPPPAATTGADAFVYFVQVGAYTRQDDAEQQRAKLALSGLSARITEREQAGRTVYRVRLGPMPVRSEADALQERLQSQGIETQIVRVEKP